MSGGEAGVKIAAAVTAVLVVVVAGCGRADCEDPTPVVDALRAPPQSVLFSRSAPPRLKRRCSQQHSLGYASNAPEEQSLEDVMAQLVAQGFLRVEPTYESQWWCDRKGSFVQLQRGELVARAIVHRTPTSQCGRNYLGDRDARACVSVTLRNDAVRSPQTMRCR